MALELSELHSDPTNYRRNNWIVYIYNLPVSVSGINFTFFFSLKIEMVVFVYWCYLVEKM